MQILIQQVCSRNRDSAFRRSDIDDYTDSKATWKQQGDRMISASQVQVPSLHNPTLNVPPKSVYKLLLTGLPFSQPAFEATIFPNLTIHYKMKYFLHLILKRCLQGLEFQFSENQLALSISLLILFYYYYFCNIIIFYFYFFNFL